MKRIGDFPSRSSIQEAERQLTECIEAWRTGGYSQNEIATILKFRGNVRVRAGDLSGALQDFDEALVRLRRLPAKAYSLASEPPEILASRGLAFASAQRWKEALEDYDAAADLLGEPLEDPLLLRARAMAKLRLGKPVAASEDFSGAADAFRRVGGRLEAEVEAERAGVVLLGAGDELLEDCEERLAAVIRRTIGLMSKDMAKLQRTVLADSDARLAMAAIYWHLGQEEMAETYWRDGCERLDTLVKDASEKYGGEGLPSGENLQCERYVSDVAWLQQERLWPDNLITWFSEFVRFRSGREPRLSFVNDLVKGLRPGER